MTVTADRSGSFSGTPEGPAPSDIVIVGASAAGLSTAEALRSKGYDGRLCLIGDEPHQPYDRPPLSKQVLAGSWDPERVLLRDDAAIAALEADWLLGRTAVGLDTRARQVVLDDGEPVGYDALVIATGVRPRRLPGDDLEGVHVVRTLDDALSLRADLLRQPRVVVVGAGFLGAEATAVARGMGIEVTLVDPLPKPMCRQFGEQIGDVVAQLHADHGVSMRLGVGVARFHDATGHVTAVELTDGEILDADVVIVAVGAAPATDWLADSGLRLDNGVECDETCQAAPGIYAAGDVASWINPHFGARMRLEHRLNATEQGIAVAANLLGQRTPFAPVPYFWSDQFDVKLQVYGVVPVGAEAEVVQGSIVDGRFVVEYRADGVVTGVVGWNMPKQARLRRQKVVDALTGVPTP